MALLWACGSAVRWIQSRHQNERRAGGIYSSAEPRSLSGASENLDLDAWYDRILYDAERSGLRLNKAAIDSGKGKCSPRNRKRRDTV